MTGMVLTSSVLILAIILLRRVLRGRIAPGLQYALWLLAALRLLVPGALFPAPVSAAGAAEGLREILVRQEETAPGLQEPAPELPGSVPEQGSGLDAPAGTSGEVHQPAGDSASARRERASSPWYVLAWGIGAAAVGGAFLASNLTFYLGLRRGRKRLCLPMETGAWETPVYLVKNIDSPCIFGLLKPAVYVNEAALRTENFEHILLHELTHVRHGDHWWALVRCVCVSLHWFNPLVWWAAVLSRRDCETACDAGVIRRLGEDRRLDYGQTLLRMIVAQPGPRDLLRASTSMSAGKRTMAERLGLIARRPRMLKLTLAAVVALMCGVVVFTFGGQAEVSEPEPDPAPADTSAEPAPTDPDPVPEEASVPGFTSELADSRARVHPSGMFSYAAPESWAGEVVCAEGPDSVAFYEAALYQEGARDGWLMSIVPQPVSWAEAYGRNDIALEGFNFNGSPYLYMVELNPEPDLARNQEQRQKTLALMGGAQALADSFRLTVTEENLYAFVQSCVENNDMSLAVCYLPYLSWSGYKTVCGEDGMWDLLNGISAYIEAYDVTWGETHNILSNRSRNDPAIDGAYATMIQEGILWPLYRQNTEQFDSVLNSIYLTADERADILEWIQPLLSENDGQALTDASAPPTAQPDAGPDGQTTNAWQRSFAGWMLGVPAAPDQEVLYDGLEEGSLRAAILSRLEEYAGRYLEENGNPDYNTRFSRIVLESEIPEAMDYGAELTVSYQIEGLQDRTYEGGTYTLASQPGDHLSTTFTVMERSAFMGQQRVAGAMGELGG